MCGCNLVTPRLIGGDRRNSSGSLAILAAMRRTSSRVRCQLAAHPAAFEPVRVELVCERMVVLLRRLFVGRPDRNETV